MHLEKSSYKYFTLSLFLFILNISLYFTLFFNNNTFQLDIDSVIIPLTHVEGILDYFKKFIKFEFMDLNPIRDLSHLLDLKISSLIKRNVSAIHNYIIFLGILFLFYKLLEKKIKWETRLLGVLILLFHPLFFNVISIETWRKHLLSCFFVMLSMNFFLNIKESSRWRGTILGNLFFILSLLSQPINLTLPVWLIVIDLFYLKNNFLSTLKRYSFTLMASIGIALLNLWYYSTIYTQYGFFKYNNGDMGDRLLALGRGITQIVFPVIFASFYSKGSYLNILGLIIFPFFLVLTYKKLEKRDFFLGWIIYFSSFILLNLRTTVIFLFDAYLLVSIFAFFYLVLLLIQKVSIKTQIIFSLITILLFSFKLYDEGKIRSVDTYTYLNHLYERQPTCNIVNSLLLNFLLQNKTEQLVTIGTESISKNCHLIFVTKKSRTYLGVLISYIFYLDKTRSLPEKIKIIYEKKESGGFDKAMLISLLIQTGKKEEAEKEFKKLISMKSQPLKITLNLNIIKDLDAYCKKDDFIDLCHKFTSHIKNLKDKNSADFLDQIKSKTK